MPLRPGRRAHGEWPCGDACCGLSTSRGTGVERSDHHRAGNGMTARSARSARSGTLDGGPILAVAHRGDSAGRPENTRAAFDAAMAGGARAIELDLRITADARVVVCHDASLRRFRAGG